MAVFQEAFIEADRMKNGSGKEEIIGHKMMIGMLPALRRRHLFPADAILPMQKKPGIIGRIFSIKPSAVKQALLIHGGRIRSKVRCIRHFRIAIQKEEVATPGCIGKQVPYSGAPEVLGAFLVAGHGKLPHFPVERFPMRFGAVVKTEDFGRERQGGGLIMQFFYQTADIKIVYGYEDRQHTDQEIAGSATRILITGSVK